MNKYITMLLLGVVIIAMALVVGVHMKQFSGESGDTENAVSSQQEAQPQDGAGQTVGGGRLTPPDEGAAQGVAAGSSASGSTSSGSSGTTQTGASAQDSSASGSAGQSAAQAGAAASGQGSGQAAGTSGSQTSGQASTDRSATSAQTTAPATAQATAQTSGQAAAVSAGQSRASSSTQTGAAQNTTGRTGATQANTAQSGTRQSGATQTSATQTAATQSATAAQSASDKAASVTHGKGSIKTMALKFRGKGMYLLLEGDSALPAKYFLLHDPERLVVDLPGAWKNLAAPTIPSNQLVKSARLGRQSNADRLVIDLSRKLKKHELVRIDDRTVEIVFE